MHEDFYGTEGYSYFVQFLFIKKIKDWIKFAAFWVFYLTTFIIILIIIIVHKNMFLQSEYHRDPL